MKVTIHRGTKEIGGSCVELQSGTTRIIIDLGMRIVNDQNEPFDSRQLDGKSIPELVASHLLPDVKGLYEGEEKGIDAVVISHPHQDHYGLLRHINPGIPVYLSKGALAMIQSSDVFIPTKANLRNVNTFKMWERFNIGGITITPQLVDHSGFDAVALVIEGEGNKIFYSGDFRGHGRKRVVFERALKRPEKDVGYLILEGSMLGRGEGLYPSEQAVEEKLASIFKDKNNIAFIFCSSQNIDRLVSIYRAGKSNGQITIIDIYTAYILNSLKGISDRLPQYWLEDVRVTYSAYHAEILKKNGLEIFLDELADHEISMGEINECSKKFVMIVKDNGYFPILLSQLDDLGGVKAVYSMWEGYLKDSGLEGILKSKGIELQKVHTSGHAPVQDLKRLVNALKPRCIVPIHTFYPQDYPSLFPNVRVLKDGEEFIM
jgi:ribonuclease J